VKEDSYMVRNSVNSPIRIDSVRLKSGGEIGMTICPGKQEDSAFSGTWSRDLDADVNAIAEWGASSVVTLMEKEELAWLKVSKIGEAVESAGMDWHSLPIEDVNVPDEHFEDLWIYSGHVLRSALADGRKVLIHCKGGLGRTGTIAARLMVELGERPADTIKKVRKARPGAIENSEQERHVLVSRPANNSTILLGLSSVSALKYRDFCSMC
jgi:ADP-ribosyl-[dinitrogen reductase] hydrolase